MASKAPRDCKNRIAWGIDSERRFRGTQKQPLCSTRASVNCWRNSVLDLSKRLDKIFHTSREIRSSKINHPFRVPKNCWKRIDCVQSRPKTDSWCFSEKRRNDIGRRCDWELRSVNLAKQLQVIFRSSRSPNGGAKPSKGNKKDAAKQLRKSQSTSLAARGTVSEKAHGRKGEINAGKAGYNRTRTWEDKLQNLSVELNSIFKSSNVRFGLKKSPVIAYSEKYLGSKHVHVPKSTAPVVELFPPPRREPTATSKIRGKDLCRDTETNSYKKMEECRVSNIFIGEKKIVNGHPPTMEPLAYREASFLEGPRINISGLEDRKDLNRKLDCRRISDHIPTSVLNLTSSSRNVETPEPTFLLAVDNNPCTVEPIKKSDILDGNTVSSWKESYLQLTLKLDEIFRSSWSEAQYFPRAYLRSTSMPIRNVINVDIIRTKWWTSYTHLSEKLNSIFKTSRAVINGTPCSRRHNGKKLVLEHATPPSIRNEARLSMALIPGHGVDSSNFSQEVPQVHLKLKFEGATNNVTFSPASNPFLGRKGKSASCRSRGQSMSRVESCCRSTQCSIIGGRAKTKRKTLPNKPLKFRRMRKNICVMDPLKSSLICDNGPNSRRKVKLCAFKVKKPIAALKSQSLMRNCQNLHPTVLKNNLVPRRTIKICSNSFKKKSLSKPLVFRGQYHLRPLNIGLYSTNHFVTTFKPGNNKNGKSSKSKVLIEVRQDLAQCLESIMEKLIEVSRSKKRRHVKPNFLSRNHEETPAKPLKIQEPRIGMPRNYETIESTKYDCLVENKKLFGTPGNLSGFCRESPPGKLPQASRCIADSGKNASLASNNRKPSDTLEQFSEKLDSLISSRGKTSVKRAKTVMHWSFGAQPSPSVQESDWEIVSHGKGDELTVSEDPLSRPKSGPSVTVYTNTITYSTCTMDSMAGDHTLPAGFCPEWLYEKTGERKAGLRMRPMHQTSARKVPQDPSKDLILASGEAESIFKKLQREIEGLLCAGTATDTFAQHRN